ncbi:MAG: right-handed parallel beta-helix repeat-containing protein [Thermoflexales bacterium]|nr:right-handed parallel beta-helix repeat-containing protein [Thermoflexales bacterium]
MKKAKTTKRAAHLTLAFALLAVLVPPFPTRAAPVIPPVWDIVSDDFESDSLDAWGAVEAGKLSLLAGGGHDGSTGLAIVAGQDDAYIYRSGVAYAAEGYLSFWFNPNGVVLPEPSPNYWPPGTSLCVGEVRSSASDWWPPLVGFYLRKPPGQGYQGFIAWPKASGYFHDYQSGQFDLADGWQKITLGYHIDAWVAVWVDDTLVRHVDTDVVHDDPSGDVIELGKVNANSSSTPSGSIRLDDVTFQVPRVDDLWVDARHGSDDHDGLTANTAFKSIQKAADLAGPGTTVHILPGAYRETVYPALSGSATENAVYIAENGPGTAIIRGSEPSSSLAWTRLVDDPIGLPAGVQANVYWADLSAWNLDGPPRFVVDMAGESRLPLAREPDWQVITEWKAHEFWWAADGGSAPAACDPVTNADHNCDLPQRSMTQLTDRTDDTEPAGVEAGNLSTLGSLIGGTLVAIDTVQGHYVYRRTITAHDVANGRITVDRVCEHDGGSGNPGLGWGSKYYVENKPYLLDTPGEWWYDPSTKRLYLWPPTPADPATLNIEISRRDNGFSLRDRSYTILDGLTIEILDGSAVRLANWETHKAYDNVVRNVTLRYANWGAYIEQSVRTDAPAGNVIDGFRLENSEIAYVDTYAIRLIDWWENSAAADSFTRPGVINTVIRHNEMHHLGFRTDGDSAVGASFGFASRLRFESNHVHHVGHNGVQFSRSVIQSSKSYDFSPSEIKTGEILIKDNVFEKACQLTTDCGGLKIWGSPPDGHVFRDVLVTGNVFRDTVGWTYVSEKRGRWSGGEGSPVRGMGGFGLYVDHASGVHAYRNVAYNNAYTGYMFSGVWRDGQMVYLNNVAANSLYGFSLGGGYDTHGSVDTQVMNNILVNNEAFGMTIGYAEGRYANMTVDYNLYHANGWGGMWHAGPMVVRESGSWDPYQTLAEVQANTPWEDHGLAGDPAWWAYDPADHDMHDGSWPDFHLTSASVNAIDKGTVQLPPSLAALLDAFDVDDTNLGTAYDIGRYEAGFAMVITPTAQSIESGGTAHYALSLYPPELPHTVTLALPNPPVGLAYTLTSAVVTSGSAVTLTVVHDGSPAGRNVWHTIPVTGTGGGFTQTLSARLLVSGVRIYLPWIIKL